MSARYTVFHVDGERGLRGGERQLLYAAAALRARGHENIVVCRRRSELEAQARKQGFEVLTLPFFFEFDPISAWRLARGCARRSRAVLHAHTAHAAGIVALAGKLAKLRPVVHRRVDFPLRGAWSRKVKYESAGRVVAVSRAIAEVLEKDGLPAGRVVVVPDALPSDDEERRWAAQTDGRFSPVETNRRRAARQELADELGLDEKTRWVGNLAALVPHKDHQTLVAAAVIVLLKRPQTRFLIAGRGPEEKNLFESIKRMGLLGKVLLVGHRGDPARFLAALDVFVLSSWGEGMGSVLLEAAACGIPIAATTAGGIPEIVEHDKSGLLAPPRDPEALADRIIRLVDDPALGRRLAAEALERLPRFGLKRLARSLEEVYAQVA